MKIIKVILGVIAGMIAITVITESIEFLIVKLASGESFDTLSNDQDYYFQVRNQLGILIAKLVYTGSSGIVGGYLAAKISKPLSKPATFVLIGLQTLVLIWAGFISGLASTGPIWMWIGLLVVVPLGIYIGFKKAAN